MYLIIWISVLFWKSLHNKTLVHSNEATTHGRKSSKKRITSLAYTNFNLLSSEKQRTEGHSRTKLFLWKTSIRIAFIKINRFLTKLRMIIENAPCHCTEEKLIGENGKMLTMFLPLWLSLWIKVLSSQQNWTEENAFQHIFYSKIEMMTANALRA